MPQGPTGRPSGPQGQSQQRLNIKIPQIARWRIAGLTEAQIAKLLGMTPQGVQVIVKSQDYVDYEAALLNKHLAKMDAALEGRVDVIQNEIRGAVPGALRCLIDVASQRKDLKAAIAASKELLDRDPDRTLTVSKSDEAIAPGVPAAVLDAAVTEGNNIASTYSTPTTPKESVN